jgi:hypothetical protein
MYLPAANKKLSCIMVSYVGIGCSFSYRKEERDELHDDSVIHKEGEERERDRQTERERQRQGCVLVRKENARKNIERVCKGKVQVVASKAEK